MQPCRCRFFALLVPLVAVCVLFGRTTSSFAQSSVVGTTYSQTDAGLKLDVDTRWIPGNGYRPVRITVTPTAQVFADRNLSFEFYIGHDWHQGYDLRFEADLELPAGTTGPVSVSVPVPDFYGWQAFSCQVFDDGILREKLSIPWSRSGANWDATAEALPKVLFVADNPPDTAQLAAMLPTHYISQFQGGNYQAGKSPLPTAFSRQADELPLCWLEYTSCDIVCLSLGDLRSLRDREPERFEALLHWVNAGGNLWVYGMGTDKARRNELAELLRLPSQPDGENDSDGDGWRKPSGRFQGQPLRGVIPNNDYSNNNEASVEMLQPGLPPLPKELTDSAKHPSPGSRTTANLPSVWLRDCRAGLIVALESDDPFPGSADYWGWVFNAMGSQRCLWYQRHGVSMVRPNPDFWNFLIPEVGLPPVVAYCVLITLFVITIGPINYWLLFRARRIYLLVVTIPLGAAAITLALFLYAMFSDGLGTKVRARTVTWLDQPGKQVACWSRLSYYAGLSPSGGLTFPGDMAIYPFVATPTDNLQRPQSRQMVWDDHLHLTSGWLNSRTPTQYLTVRSRNSKARLDIRCADGDSPAATVRNELGSNVRQLVVCVAADNYLRADEVADGATAALKPVSQQTALSELRRLRADHSPTLPPGFDNDRYGGFFGFRNRAYWRFYGGGNAEITEPHTASGRLETGLAALTQPLKPGTYVAIVDRSPEVAYGLPSVEETGGFHVILGRWK